MIESQSACPGGNLVLRSTAQVVVVGPAKLLAVTYSKTSVAKAIWYSQSQVCGLCQTKARWQEVDQSQVAVGSSGKWQPKSLMVVAPRRNCRRRQLPGHRWPIRPRTHNQGLQSIINIIVVVRTIMDGVIKGCLRFDNATKAKAVTTSLTFGLQAPCWVTIQNQTLSGPKPFDQFNVLFSWG